MTFFHVVFLAAVQGITEFLPVSSSGHLLAARFLFGISDVDGTAFDAFLHIGTLLAVLVYYWQTWMAMLVSMWRRSPEDDSQRALLFKLGVATVPAALVGYLFQDVIGQYFRSPQLLAIALLLTAFLLWWFDRESNRSLTVENATYGKSLYIGLWQTIALIPGISRSGMTIAAGRSLGLSRQQAANFSFLLSAPIIAGASLTSIPTLQQGGEFPYLQLILGGAISFIVGLAAIYTLLKVVEKISFRPFAIYLVALAMVILIWV